MSYLSSLSTGIQWVVQKIAQIVSVHVNALEFTLHVLHLKLLFCYVSVKSLFHKDKVHGAILENVSFSCLRLVANLGEVSVCQVSAPFVMSKMAHTC